MLPIRTYPHPGLRERSVEVETFDDELRALVAEMIETMYEADGVGLAAPQIAVNRRILVFDVNPEDRGEEGRLAMYMKAGDDPQALPHGAQVLINPVLVSKSKAMEVREEGCLSVPEISGNVKRPAEVRVEGVNLAGEPVAYEGGGLLARCLQHEMDHLDGILFIDKLSVAAKLSLRRELRHREEAFRDMVGD